MRTNDDLVGPRVPHLGAGAQLLILFGLTGFAISQPVLAVAGENPATFAFRSVDGLELVAFALVVAVVPPLVLWGAIRLVALASARAADVVVVAAVGVLGALTGIQAAKAIGAQAPVLIALAGLVAAVVVVAAYVRFTATALWLRFTAVLPVAAVALFLVASPTGALLRPQSVEVGQRDAAGLPPVVMIMLDEFPTQSLLGPDGGVDPVRFPNLARLAERSTWYRDYTVLASETLLSVPSILTGTLPENAPALASSHPENLFTLLAPTHDLHVYETATKLCEHPQCAEQRAASTTGGLGELLGDMAGVWTERIALGPSAEPDLGEFAERVVSRPAESSTGDDAGRGDGSTGWMDGVRTQVVNTPTRVQDFIDSFNQRGDRPGFHYLHLLLPHQPWTFFPDGSRYLPLLAIGSDEWSRAMTEQRHLFQAEYADRLVGQMIEGLEASGQFDDSLLVVTADHGVSFAQWPNGRELAPDRVGAIAYTPLFVKLPHQTAGSVSDRNVNGTDLVPTIAATVDAAVTWPVAGAPLESDEVAARGRQKHIYDFGMLNARAERHELTFDDADRPSADTRLIGPIWHGESPIAGLVRGLGVADLLGAPVDDIHAPVRPGTASFLDRSLLAADTEPELDFISELVLVRAEGFTGDEVALVAVDGTVVSAAPLTENRFEVLWPSADLLHPSAERVRILIGHGDDWAELQFDCERLCDAPSGS